MRGLSVEPIHSNVRKFLGEVRDNKPADEQLGEQELYFYKDPSVFQKTPWIRFSSNAINVFSESTGNPINPESWVLAGGVVKSVDPNTQGRLGVAPYIEKLSGWRNTGFGTQYAGDRRNLPRPGITNISVNAQGKLGTTREATVNITIPFEGDLEIIEKLYMVPGVYCLLEWGWSDYSGDVINLTDFNDVDDVHQAIIERELGLSEFSLNENLDEELGSINPCKYAGMFGVIFNYTFNASEDGGYVAAVKLKGPNYFLPERNIKTNILPAFPATKYDSLIVNQEGEVIAGNQAETDQEYSEKNQQPREESDTGNGNSDSLKKREIEE